MTVIPPEELARRIAALPWTNQNMELAPGVWTVPGTPPILTDPRVRCAVRTVQDVFGRDLSGVRIADLGCLEGGISLAFALEGAEVLGIEGREANIAKCELVREAADLPNLGFALDDVRRFTRERYGEFDAVLVCGLLYHLDEPVAWLRQAAACARRMIFVDTHFAPETDAGTAAMDTMPFFDLRANPLGPLVTVSDGEGDYEGRWWFEFPEAASAEDRAKLLWASLDNPRSMWLTRRSVYRLLAACGFESVGERLDFAAADDIPVLLREKSRTCFTGVRARGQDDAGAGRGGAQTLPAAIRRLRSDWRLHGPRAALRKMLDL